MLNIKILGRGCESCYTLESRVMEALAVLGLEGMIQHVYDRQQHRKYHLIYPPGLVVNERLVSGGRVPETSEVVTMLTRAVSQ